MAKNLETFEGEAIIGHRVKVLRASGLVTDTVGHKGQWGRVTIEGPFGPTTFDPQQGGWVREIELTAAPGRTTVQIIETPPEEPEIEGQASLADAEAPAGPKAVRDDKGEPVAGPED